jgi:hypothetical protein
MTNDIILIRNEELLNLVKEAVRTELQSLIQEKHESDTDEVLTSEEVLTLLKISQSYLIKLRSHGLLLKALFRKSLICWIQS